MTLVLWTETTNASARSYERRHLSRSTSRKSVAGLVSSYRTSRREIASPTMGDQQGGCKTLEKLQTTGRGRRWGSPGQPPAAAAAEASSAPAGRRGAPAGAAAAVGGELEEGGARATSGWNLSRDSRKSATAQAAPPCPARGLLGRCTGVLLVVVATAALAAAALGGLHRSAPGARPAAALGGATAACRDGRGGLGGDEGGRCRRLVREGEFLQAQGPFASRKEGKGWLRLR